MVRFEECVVINRPLQDVFAFISDMENDPPWTSATEVRRTSPGPLGIGTTFRQKARFLGRNLELPFEVVGYEPNHSIAVTATSGILSLEGSRIVDPVGEHATRVTASGGGHARGVLRLAEPLLAAIGARQLRGMLARLKEVLEPST
jgi:carbon monoxide dehydrogenase subunit G